MSIVNVIKRDGIIQPFNIEKVRSAVSRAFASVNQELPDKFWAQLVGKLDAHNEDLGVEDIQDIIQKELIRANKYDVVESFIWYRKKRTEKREEKSPLISAITIALNASNVQNQNANVDEYSFGGRVGASTRIVCQQDALKRMSRKSRRNHEQNMIYIHDLDSYSVGETNCLSEPFDTMLNKRIKTRQCDVRAAGSANTAMQLVAVYFQIQSLQQFGGVSATHIDWTMVPFVRKSFKKHYLTRYCESLPEFYDLDILGMGMLELREWVADKVVDFFMQHPELDDFKQWRFDNRKMFDAKLFQRALYSTRKETEQAVEGLLHNLNTLQSRAGNQLPFSSLNYGTCTELEGRMVIKALLEVSLEGLGTNGTTSIFPCGIFQVMSGVNKEKGTPNYDLKRLALKSTSQRIYPNYANCDWSNQKAQITYDRNIKQSVIDALNAEERRKLYNTLKGDSELADKLDIVLKMDGGMYIQTEKQHPYEIFSTMGKRNTIAHLKPFEPYPRVCA